MLNNKGFTVIELVLSFAFVSVLSVSLFAVVINYREKQQESSIETKLLSYKSKLIVDVQNDIQKKVLDSVDYCKYTDSDGKVKIKNRCVILSFRNGETKTFEVKEEKGFDTIGTNEYDYSIPYISYGGIKYIPPDGKNLAISTDYMFQFTTLEDDLENNTTLYRIKVGLIHNDIDRDFEISIVALGTKNIKDGVASEYDRFNIGDKVTIQINGTTQKSFYVIKDSGEYNSKLTLLLDQNIGEDYYNSSISFGDKYESSSVKAKLENLTRNWINVDSVRLITAEELGYLVYACPKYQTENAPDLDLSGAPSWVYSSSYWTMSPKLLTTSDNGKKVWVVDKNSKKMTNAFVDSTSGIRPVIEVHKRYVTAHD